METAFECKKPGRDGNNDNNNNAGPTYGVKNAERCSVEEANQAQLRYTATTTLAFGVPLVVF